MNPFDSELLASFSGNNISAYQPDGTTFSSVIGNFLVHFTSNRETEKKGFVMKYKVAAYLKLCALIQLS